MMEIIDRRGLKAEMRELLRGAQVDPRMFAALFLLLTAALGALDSLVSGGTTAGNPLSLFVRILTSLLSAVLSVGFVLYCMAVRRGQRAYTALAVVLCLAFALFLLLAVLGGLLAPLERMDSESLDLDRLTRRLDEGEVTELILALGATLEAENTASFIRQMVRKRFPRIRVSRLAQGIPLGAEVKYMDKETLRQSLQYRQDL